MAGRLAGKNALVTGANKGIGRAIAERLAKEGARVAVCARKEAEAEAVAQAIAKDGGEAHAVGAGQDEVVPGQTGPVQPRRQG